MHVLIISSEPYLIPTVPLGGIFQMHQAKALHQSDIKVGISSGGLLPFRDIFKFTKIPQIESTEIGCVSRYFTKSIIPLRFSAKRLIHKKNIKNTIKSIQNYIDKEGIPDLLHAHNLQYAGIAAHSISSKIDIPLIITEHSSSFLRDQFPSDLYTEFYNTLKGAAYNLAVSSSLAKKMNEIFLLEEKKFTVIPNVIDFELSQTPQRKNSKFTFINIGRLDENKNHQLLIKAFAEAFQGKPVELRIGGIGHQESNLRKLTKSLKVDDQITFLGFLDREQVACELARSHCFVLPSITETFGVVIIEALSKGLPVISTPSGGPIDIVNDSNGIITQDYSVNSLSEAMIKIFEKILDFDSKKIKHDAQHRYSNELFSKTIKEIYLKTRKNC